MGQQRQKFDQIYGSMIMIMGYLPQIEQLKLQGLDSWWYTIGVGRVQVFLEGPEQFYLVYGGGTQIMAVSKTLQCKWFNLSRKKQTSTSSSMVDGPAANSGNLVCSNSNAIPIESSR